MVSGIFRLTLLIPRFEIAVILVEHFVNTGFGVQIPAAD